MSPESVSTCNPVKIMEGVRLQPRELGRGSFGVVVLGSFHGQAVAVKVMLTSGLDRSALRELLLAPSLVHPCLVMVCLGSVARGWARRCGGQWNRVWGPARAQGTCYHSWEVRGSSVTWHTAVAPFISQCSATRPPTSTVYRWR